MNERRADPPPHPASPELTHLALSVRDSDAAVAFYREFCGLDVVRERAGPDGPVRWLAEPGRGGDFVFVLIPGCPRADRDGRVHHFGFGVAGRADVDRLAERARARGLLCWEPRDDEGPVGYSCAVRDPDGNVVEFSFGQPLGRFGRRAGPM